MQLHSGIGLFGVDDLTPTVERSADAQIVLPGVVSRPHSRPRRRTPQRTGARVAAAGQPTNAESPNRVGLELGTPFCQLVNHAIVAKLKSPAPISK